MIEEGSCQVDALICSWSEATRPQTCLRSVTSFESGRMVSKPTVQWLGASSGRAAQPGAQPDGPVSGFNLAGIGAARRLPYTSGVCFLKTATTGQGRSRPFGG